MVATRRSECFESLPVTPEPARDPQLHRKSNRGIRSRTSAARGCETPDPGNTDAFTRTPNTRANARRSNLTPGCQMNKATSQPSQSVGQKRTKQCPVSPKNLPKIFQNGETYKLGDDVLYIIDGEEYEEMASDIDDDKEHLCALCRKPRQRKGTELIECDYCLRPYHVGCVSDEPVNGAAWMCLECKAGKALPSDSPTRHIDIFLRTEGIIGVGRIVRMFQDGNKQKQVAVKKYLPRQSGAQDSIACELHATEETEEVPAEHLIRHVTVACSRDEYEAAPTLDAFLCRSKFNVKLGVYERLNPSSKDADYCAESESSSEEESEEESDLSSDEEEQEEQCTAPSQQKKRKRKALGLGRCKVARQGGEAWVERQQGEVVRSTLEHRRKKDESPACAVLRLLTLTERPACLPCRDAEKQRIRNFIQHALTARRSAADHVNLEQGTDQSKCLYVAGVPGTGKTACVTEVLQGLKSCPSTADFRLVYINALYLPTPAHFYSKLFESINGHSIGAAAARIRLEEFFLNQKRSARATVLVVDEMDMLLTRDQQVIYNLVSWPHVSSAPVAVIGIANTLDLQHRLLPKILSRMGDCSLSFGPYTRQQMVDIVKDRIRDVAHVIEDRAVDHVARKVAGVTGDIRKTLAILRQAVLAWRALPDPGPCVTSKMAIDAAKATFEAKHMKAMEQLAPLEQILIASIILETRFTEKVACDLAAVSSRTTSLLRLQTSPQAVAGSVASAGKQELVPAGIMFMAVRQLASSRLISISRQSDMWSQLLTLNVPVDDALHVLMGSEHITWIHQILGA